MSFLSSIRFSPYLADEYETEQREYESNMTYDEEGNPIDMSGAMVPRDWTNWHVYNEAGGAMVLPRSDQPHLITRRIPIYFWGTPKTLTDMTFTMDKSQFQSVSRPGSRPEGWVSDGETPGGDVSKILLRNVRVLSERNPWPVPLGVNLPGVRGNFLGQGDGQRYSHVMIPSPNGLSHENLKINITPYNTASEYMKKHGTKLTEEALKEDVHPMPSGRLAMVAWDSPIAEVLEQDLDIKRIDNVVKTNSELEDEDNIDYEAENEGERVCKYTTQNIREAIAYILQNKVKGVPLVDMENFTATATRCDAGGATNDYSKMVPMCQAHLALPMPSKLTTPEDKYDAALQEYQEQQMHVMKKHKEHYANQSDMACLVVEYTYRFI